MNKKELYKEVEDLDLFNIGIRKYVALSEVMYLIKQLDEPQKVEIPKFVDDWIEYCKEHNFTLLGCLDPVDDFGMSLSEGFKGDTRKCVKWCRKESNTFAIAWLFGYKVNEKKYIIKFKNVQKGSESFKFDMVTGKWYFGFNQESSTTRLYHTKEDLVNAGFEWMFSCPGFNVEEVE